MSHTLTISFPPVSPAPPNGYRVKYWKLSDPANVTTIFPNPTTSPVNITVPNFESYAGTIEASCTGGTYSTIQTWTAREQFVMQANAVTQAPGSLGAGVWTVRSSLPFDIIWGDGNTDTFPAGSPIYIPAHTYASPYTGPIIIECDDLTAITELDISNGANPASTSPRPIVVDSSEIKKLDGLTTFVAINNRVNTTGVIGDLPASLETFHVTVNTLSGNLNTLNCPNLISLIVSGSNLIDGDVVNFSNTLEYLELYGNNTISGVVADWPTAIKTFRVTGGNTLSGNIQDAPPNCEWIYVLGNNFIGGLIQSLACPNIFAIQIQGANTIGGSINTFATDPNFANLQTFILLGGTTINGDVGNFNLGIDYVWVEGTNGLSGDVEDLPVTLTFIRVFGNNVISGDIDNGLPGGLEYIYLRGLSSGLTGNTDNLATMCPNMYQFYIIKDGNTLAGDVAALPATMLVFGVGGFNHTISGEIANCPPDIRNLYLSTGNLNTTTYLGYPRVWTPGMNEIYLRRSPDYTSAELDNLFIDLDNSTTTTSWIGSKFINVKGPVTGASLAARTSLTTTKGVTINIIP